MLWAALCITANLAADVRFGSKADIAVSPLDVRFTPESGHGLNALGCPCTAADNPDGRTLLGSCATFTLQR